MTKITLAITMLLATTLASAKTTTKTFKFDSFTKIEASGSANIQVKIGKTQSVEISTEEKNFDYLEVTMHKGTLEIEKESNGIFDHCPGDCMYTAKITVTSLEEMQFAGSVDVSLTNMNGENLKLELAGSTEVKMAGKVTNLKIKTAGSAEVEAFELVADNVKISSAGSSDIEVHAVKELEAKVAGSGEVTYKGNPTKINQKVAGSGTINKANM